MKPVRRKAPLPSWLNGAADSGIIIDNQSSINRPFGLLGTVSKNGCGAVAVYNALVLLERPVSLGKVLSKFRFVFMGGILGCHSPKVLLTLRKFGAKSFPITKRKADKEKKDGTIVIAKICRHSKNPLTMHFVVCSFSDGLWKIYNPLSSKLPKTSLCLKDMFSRVTLLGLWKIVKNF